MQVEDAFSLEPNPFFFPRSLLFLWFDVPLADCYPSLSATRPRERASGRRKRSAPHPRTVATGRVLHAAPMDPRLQRVVPRRFSHADRYPSLLVEDGEYVYDRYKNAMTVVAMRRWSNGIGGRSFRSFLSFDQRPHVAQLAVGGRCTIPPTSMQ